MRECDIDCAFCEKEWCDDREKYQWRADWFESTEDEFGEYCPDDFEW